MCIRDSSRTTRTVGPSRCRARPRTSPAACRTAACAQQNLSNVGALSFAQASHSLGACSLTRLGVLRLAIRYSPQHHLCGAGTLTYRFEVGCRQVLVRYPQNSSEIASDLPKRKPCRGRQPRGQLAVSAGSAGPAPRYRGGTVDKKFYQDLLDKMSDGCLLYTSPSPRD